MALKIVEHYSVSPSPGAAEQWLPLVYFDMIWLHREPTETLYFYPLNCSQSCFLDTTAVSLKHSLSIALKHFLPLASTIIFPLTSAAVPLSRYTPGDSVSLTIATSAADFANLTANHPKDADEFHQFVPQMPLALYSFDEIKFSAIAIQVTLFPNKGICIGFTHHHAICDASTLLAFLRTWASINKSNGGEDHLLQDSLPFYARDSVQDQDSNKLTIFGWNQIKMNRPVVSLKVPLPLHKVRATFHLSDAEIEKLKCFARIKSPGIARVSTFVAVCAHLWSSLAKSAAAAGEVVDDGEPEYLGSPVDCRGRINPPLPENYFGNCLMLMVAVSSHGRLKGKEGFVAAAEAVAAAISKTVENSTRVSDFFENRSQILSGLVGKRVVSIAGSSRFDHYGADYGWGRATKYECIHTDLNGGVHFCKARDGGVEIGLSMPKLKMDIFAAMFKRNLHINSNL